MSNRMESLEGENLGGANCPPYRVQIAPPRGYRLHPNLDYTDLDWINPVSSKHAQRLLRHRCEYDPFGIFSQKYSFLTGKKS